MSSIFSTQKRHTFLRRKYCFLVARALSPPVGLCDALMGRPPLDSAIILSSYSFSTGATGAAAGAAGAAAGAAGAGAPGIGAPGRGPVGSAPAIIFSTLSAG